MTGGNEVRLRVACAQLAARDLREAETALAEALEAVAAAAGRGADLVVVPECTYPAYVLAEDPEAPPIRPDGEVEEAFAEAARRHCVAVMAGLAQGYRPGAGVRARNVGVLFDAAGRVRLRTAKRFLWDFDRRWFEPGRESVPGDLGGTPVGALVCADLRQPEVARSLAVTGARLILDPTAWVTTGRDPWSLSNPQPEFLVSVRALENGAWIAAANKVGVEREAVVYCGRSGVWGPDGSPVVVAGPTQPEIVVADVDLGAATGPPVARRPDLYGVLARPVEESPAWKRSRRPVVPAAGTVRIGLLQHCAAPLPGALAGEAGARSAVIDALGIDLVAAVLHGAGDVPRNPASTLHGLLGAAVVLGALDPRGRVEGALLASGSGTGSVLPTHGPNAATGAGLDGRAIDLGEVRAALVLGGEGLVPEVPRALVLEGAELLVWLADAGTPLVDSVARARALENRVYVALVAPGLALFADPDGRILAAGLEGRDQVVHGVVHAAAWTKQMAPGTDVLSGRQPATYGALLAPIAVPEVAG